MFYYNFATMVSTEVKLQFLTSLDHFWPDPYDTFSKVALFSEKMHKVFKNKVQGCCTPLTTSSENWCKHIVLKVLLRSCQPSKSFFSVIHRSWQNLPSKFTIISHLAISSWFSTSHYMKYILNCYYFLNVNLCFWNMCFYLFYDFDVSTK